MTNTIDKATLLGQILAWGNCRATCAMDTHSAWAEVVKSLDAIDGAIVFAVFGLLVAIFFASGVLT